MNEPMRSVLQDMPSTELGVERALQVVVVQTRMLERFVTSKHNPQQRKITRTWSKRKLNTQRAVCNLRVEKWSWSLGEFGSASFERNPERVVCEEIDIRLGDGAMTTFRTAVGSRVRDVVVEDSSNKTCSSSIREGNCDG